MNEMLILGAIVLVLWAGVFYLRVPSSIAFLSLLIGQLLSTEASGDVFDFVAGMVRFLSVEYIQAALLVLPLILTLAILRNRVPKPKMLVEALPILFIVCLTVLLVAPLITPLNTLVDIATKDKTDAYKSIVVVAASLSGLLSAWLSYPKAKEHGKHH